MGILKLHGVQFQVGPGVELDEALIGRARDYAVAARTSPVLVTPHPDGSPDCPYLYRYAEPGCDGRRFEYARDGLVETVILYGLDGMDEPDGKVLTGCDRLRRQGLRIDADPDRPGTAVIGPP